MTAAWMIGVGAFFLVGCGESIFQEMSEIRFGMERDVTRQSANHPDSLTHVVRIAVPFFPDDTDQCGPATLASVLAYWGVPVGPQVLKEEIYTASLKGTLPIDLLLAAQTRGLKVQGLNGTVEMLKSELDAGHPVVALLNLGWAIFPQGHYVVMTGYDERRQGVFMHSGVDQDVFVPYDRFLADWRKTGRWMLLVQPKAQLVNLH